MPHLEPELIVQARRQMDLVVDTGFQKLHLKSGSNGGQK